MDLGALVPIAAPVATVIAAAVAAQPLLRQYELKAKEERRLAETSRVEADVRLVEAFTTLMGKAHARGPTVVLEQALIKLIEQRASVSPEEFEALADACVVVSPVGAAEQDAAIAAIAELGIEHPVLRYPAERALEEIRTFRAQQAEHALARLMTGRMPQQSVSRSRR